MRGTAYETVKVLGDRKIQEVRQVSKNLLFDGFVTARNYWLKKIDFKIVFTDKKINSAGLQFADLIARPIG